MAFSASATVEIDAPAERVWEVLVDVERWSEWSSWLAWEGGAFVEGERIALRLTPPNGDGWSFRPTVLAVRPASHLAWVGRTAGLPGLFDGEHHFRLASLPAGRTRLINEERYSGLLSPLVRRLPQMQDLDAGFSAMNNEIRARAEATGPSGARR